MTEPMIVPEALAQRLRAIAEARSRDPDELLAATLAAIIVYYEHDRDTRHGHWLLSILHAEDGPTPPTGLGKALPSWPRWRIEPLWPDDESEEAGPAEEGEAPATEATPCAEPAVLVRDDGVLVVVELLTRQSVIILTGVRYREDGKTALDECVRLDRCEVWADCSRSAWHKMLSAADSLADRLVASRGADPANPTEPPQAP